MTRSSKSPTRRATPKEEKAAPAEMHDFHVELKFLDKNQPSICADVKTKEEAMLEASIMRNRYEGRRCFWITDSDGDTVAVFDHDLNYCFAFSKKAVARIPQLTV